MTAGTGPGNRFGRDRRLFAAIVIISIAAVLASWLAVRKAEHHLLEVEATATAIHWATFLQENLLELDEILRDGLVSAKDQRVFNFASQAGRVFRYEVIRSDGVTALSSWAGDFQKSDTTVDLSEVIESGRPIVNLIEGKRFDQNVLVMSEAYVPVRAGDRIDGAIKVYVDMTRRAVALRQIGNKALAALIGLLSVIGALCGSFVVLNIRDRNQELRKIVESREQVRAAEMTIRKLHRQNEMILNAAGEGIYGLDTQGRTTFVNPAAANMIGWEAGELIGKSQHDILHHTKPDGSPYPREECPIYAAFKDGSVRHVTDEVFWRKDGTSFQVEYTSSPMRNEDGTITGAVVVYSDITTRKRAEQELLDSKQDLERQSRELEEMTEYLIQARDLAEAASRAKSEFLAAMSHELRTPLNAIIGFSEILKDELFGPAGSVKNREYAHDINESGQHLLTLINDILDLSKVESGADELHDEDIEIAEVIGSVEMLVKDRASKGGVELEFENPDELPALRADARKLKQILVNLLSNAIKFTAPGGKVTLRTWCRLDSGMVFQVTDTGIGMATEDIPKALSPFSQVDSDLSRKYEGTGLGLPLTKGLVEMHSGSLDLQSEVDVGTTVTVRFPAERIVRSPRHIKAVGAADRKLG